MPIAGHHAFEGACGKALIFVPTICQYFGSKNQVCTLYRLYFVLYMSGVADQLFQRFCVDPLIAHSNATQSTYCYRDFMKLVSNHNFIL